MSQLPNPQVTPCLVTIPSSPFDKRSLMSTCLVGTPSWMDNFHHPCLLASSPPALLCTLANDYRSSAPALLFIPSQWHKVFSTRFAFFGTPHAFLAPHMPFWHPTCLFGAPHAFLAPHMPFGSPHALWRPICLMTPYLPYGTPSALWRPICLFWCPSAFLAPTSAFWRPICLLQAPSAFWLPIFLKRSMTKCMAVKRGPGFQFPGCNLWMTMSSCAMTNQL